MRFFNDSKKILQIAMPLLSSRLMNVIVFFAGFVMVAKLGPNEFAASSLASSIFMTLIMVAVGILYAVGIKISHAFGADNYEKIHGYFYGGLILSILLSVLAIIFLIALSFLLPYLGQKPALIPDAKKFMYALSLPILPALLTVAGNQLVTALLKPRIVFISSVINVPITIGAFYLLIFGGFGIPPLGIWGFGWALFIGDIFLVLVILFYILATDYFKQFKLFNSAILKTNLWQHLKEIMQLGVPMGIQFGAEIAALSISTFLIGRFGVAALDSYQIANQIIIVALMIPFTISEAAAILVGNALGRKDLVDIRAYGFSSIGLGILFLTLISIIFYIMPKVLINIYLDVNRPDFAPIVNLSILFLYVAAISQVFDGIRHIVTGALRGLHDSKYPMYIGIAVMWLLSLPIGILLAFYYKVGPIGFEISIGFACLIGSLILLSRFNKKSKSEASLYKSFQSLK